MHTISFVGHPKLFKIWIKHTEEKKKTQKKENAENFQFAWRTSSVTELEDHHSCLHKKKAEQTEKQQLL